jgi:Flp pilus assembly protein TadD
MLKTSQPRATEARAGYPSATFRINDEKTQQMAGILQMVSAALDSGDIGTAERHLRLGLQDDPENPRLLSYLSICVASAGRELETAEELARKITKEFPQEAAGHFALGKVKLIGNKRRYAFQNFRKARQLARTDSHMLDELDRMEPRRAPVFSGLARDHFLNVLFGKIRARFGAMRGGNK